MTNPDVSLKKLDRILKLGGVQDLRLRQMQNLMGDQDQRIAAMVNLKPKDRQQPAQAIQQHEQDIEDELQDRKDYQAKAHALIRDLNNRHNNRTVTLSGPQLNRLQALEQRYATVDTQITNFENDFNQQKQDFRERFRQNPPAENLGMLRHAWDWTFMGLSCHEAYRGTYFTISGQSKRNPYTGRKEPTDEQIRETLQRLVREEGQSVIHCYYGNDIDPQLTMRTKKILSDMMQPGHILEGYNVQVSGKRMTDLEPWRWDNPATRFSHKWDTWKENRAEAKAEAKSIKEESRSPIGRALNPLSW